MLGPVVSILIPYGTCGLHLSSKNLAHHNLHCGSLSDQMQCLGYFGLNKDMSLLNNIRLSLTTLESQRNILCLLQKCAFVRTVKKYCSQYK